MRRRLRIVLFKDYSLRGGEKWCLMIEAVSSDRYLVNRVLLELIRTSMACTG